ncbi:hypothetical protein LY78DRAFT_704696 [Colletotrichum sublineola]|nr:hypothetical protein LY78DRAFT_704696 [Colletotrichum sublineola]
MATKEFHLFSLLPGELREQIWDHSVRPHGSRGVQYFSVFPEWDIDEEFSRHLIPMTRPSWNQNRSTYAIDGGLWTACKESRAAMHRRYKPEQWTTFLVNSDNSHQYFTLLPAQDLIVIQGYHSVPDMQKFPTLMPFGSPRCGFGGISHIGIAFDPSWTLEELHLYEMWEWTHDCNLPGYRWATYNGLISAIRDHWCSFFCASIWLVDPRLRRRNTETPTASQNSAKEASEQIVFEGNGCKYYEVSGSTSYYDAETADQPGFLSIWDFAYEVEEAAARIEACEEGIDLATDDIRTLHEFKYLVCEKDE